MSDSSDEAGEDGVWTLYKDKDEWKDVTPIPQDDGSHPVVAIAYSDKCKVTILFIFTFYCLFSIKIYMNVYI